MKCLSCSNEAIRENTVSALKDQLVQRKKKKKISRYWGEAA